MLGSGSALASLLVLSCQPTPTVGPNAPESGRPHEAIVRACVHGPGTLRLGRRGDTHTLDVGDGECHTVELALGERIFLKLSQDERASGAVIFGVAPGVDVSFELPAGTGSVPARFTSDSDAARFSRLATDYMLRGRDIALSGGDPASVQADDAWAKSEAAESGLVSDGHRVIWAVSMLADRSGDVHVDLDRLRAFARDLAPESLAWALEPELSLLLAEADVIPNGLAEAVRTRNPDPNARAAASIVALRDALDRSDDDRARTILAELNGSTSPFAELARSYDPDGTLIEGEDVPPLQISDPVGGARFSLSEPRGRPVVAYFWSSWCSPCTEHIAKVLVPLSQRYGDQIEVVTISLDETWSDAATFIEANPMPWRQGYVPTSDQAAVRRAFEIWSSAKLVLIDPEGRVALEDPAPGALREALAGMLAEASEG